MRKTFLNLKFEVPIRHKGGKLLEHELLCLAIAIYAAYLTTPDFPNTSLPKEYPARKQTSSHPLQFPRRKRGAVD